MWKAWRSDGQVSMEFSEGVVGTSGKGRTPQEETLMELSL